MVHSISGPACRGPVPATEQELERAVANFAAAQEVYGPDNLEPTFWHAVALRRAGHRTAAAPLVARLTKAHPGWATALEHVVGSARRG